MSRFRLRIWNMASNSLNLRMLRRNTFFCFVLFSVFFSYKNSCSDLAKSKNTTLSQLDLLKFRVFFSIYFCISFDKFSSFILFVRFETLCCWYRFQCCCCGCFTFEIRHIKHIVRVNCVHANRITTIALVCEICRWCD